MKILKENQVSICVIFFSLLAEILYPYAIQNSESILSQLVLVIFFFSLPCLAYYLGKNKQQNYGIFVFSALFNIIYSIITKSDFCLLYTTKILVCSIIWSLIKVEKKSIIFFLFIISLVIGFLQIDHFLMFFISLLPFYLLGKNIEIKKKNKILGYLLMLLSIIGTIFITNKFYVSYSILFLEPFASKKYVIFRLGYYIISLMMILAFSLIGEKSEKNLNFTRVLAMGSITCALFLKIVDINFYNNLYILYGIIACILTFTLEYIIRKLNILKKVKINKTILNIIIAILFIASILINVKFNYVYEPIYEKISKSEQTKIDESLKISFVGDLILLENQVRSAYTNSGYNFDKMFEYTKKYFASSDLVIGVLEGPVASGDYTVGNFDDGVPIYFNFPTEFLTSIKNSGINLVTTATNHILDKGIVGAEETIKNLDDIELDYVGSFNNRFKIIEKDGVRIGVLAYTYGSNYYEEDELIDLDITSVIVAPSSKNFKSIKKKVEEDFKNLKNQNVDLIIVLPHMGTQFSHESDVFQNTWNKIFIDNGASIILSDHSHAVQPIVYSNESIVVNSPGNFANQYVDYDGDATSIVEIYVDKSNKKIVASSVIPMYTQGYSNGFYRALPIYDIYTNDELYSSISKYELNRISEVNNIVTETMLGEKVQHLEERYYLFKDGYKRSDVKPLDISNLKNKEIYNLIDSVSSVCFVGDSITEGTKNGGYGWYEPLMSNFNKDIKTAAYGSYTTKLLLTNKSKELKDCSSELNIIAIGTNDIRYRDSSKCAMNSFDYIKNIKDIVNLIGKDKKYIFIAPWASMNNDIVTSLTKEEKEKLYKDYSDALKKYALENNYLFVDPNLTINSNIYIKESNYYMLDGIHPNNIRGIYLYSSAVMNSD